MGTSKTLNFIVMVFEEFPDHREIFWVHENLVGAFSSK